MANATSVKYFRHPIYDEADWDARNPLLDYGEVGVLMVGGLATRLKIGPGYWNDLEYLDAAILDRLEALENPYQQPVISSVANDANGSMLDSQVLGIGKTLNGPVHVGFQVSNQANLSGSTPINITAGGVFSNEGDFPVGTATLTLANPLTPTSLTIITIRLVATHTNGVTEEVTTTISFLPSLIWGVSSAASLLAADWFTLMGRSTLKVSSFLQDLKFNVQGYCWFAIPSMFNPANLSFADVSLPDIYAKFGVQAMGTQALNSGISTYNYETFRSIYPMTAAPYTIRIKQLS